MRVQVVTQPEPLLEIDEVKTALGESGSDRDSLITGLILAAQAELDGPKGIVGVTVAEQTVEVYFDDFDCEPLILPGGTIIAPLTSVQYLDASGGTQALDTASYALRDGNVIVAATGAPWPVVSTSGSAVWATYDLGIIDEADPRIGLMKTAMLTHIKMTLDMGDPALYRRAIEALVAPMRAITL